MLTPINIRTRSSFSHLRSTLDPKHAIAIAKSNNQPAIGLIDINSLAASLDFAKTCQKSGIQPVVGCDFATPNGFLTLISKTEQGWTNLMLIAGLASRSADQQVKVEDIVAFRDGLYALTGAPESIVGNLLPSEPGEALSAATALYNVFGTSLIIEIQRQNKPAPRIEMMLNTIAEKLEIPLIGTSIAACEPGGEETLLLLTAIAQQTLIDSPDLIPPLPAQSMKTSEELETLFADAPWLLDNTNRLALSCSLKAVPQPQKPHLPRFAAAEGKEDEMMIRLARQGYAKKLKTVDPDKHPQYLKRLETELEIICKQGFSGYFLIVADFIGWAKSKGIPVGPGRGSGAGSAVAWAMGITDLDPIRWGLLFERFINPERVSLPDFDVDFCQDRRDEVIEYVRNHYGEKHVAAIGVSMTWGGRAAFRDAARALGVPNGAVNNMVEHLHHKDPYSIAAMEEPALEAFRARPEMMRALEMGEPLQGFIRQRSRHAAGIIISDAELETTVPLMSDPGGGKDIVTQYDMKGVEDAGLVKFDFLGLKTLSVIKAACENIELTGQPAPDMMAIGFEDEAVFRLLNSGQCHGIFQLESEGMVKSLRQIQMNRFEDIIALVALYRPGPMEFIPNYAHRKQGSEAVTIPHPKLEKLLEETYGIMIYQEQIIELAQIMAGYTKGGADLLRRAIGKKIASEMEAQRETFINGCVREGHSRTLGQTLFELIEKFANYGFNKSHAAAYALITWQTAWLKTHHPAAFYAAAMTYVGDTHDKLRQIANEAQANGIVLLPPRIGLSDVDFRPETITAEDGSQKLGVRWGLGAVKGLGYAFTTKLSRAARTSKPADIAALAKLVANAGGAALQSKALGECGALDSLHTNRAQAIEHLGNCVRFEKQKDGGEFLFSLTGPDMPNVVDFDIETKRNQELDAIGVSFHDHPAAKLRKHARRLAAIPLNRIDELTDQGAFHVLVRIDDITPPKRGNTTIIRLSDADGEIEVSCDSSLIDPDMPADVKLHALDVINNTKHQPLAPTTAPIIPGQMMIVELVRKFNDMKPRLISAKPFHPDQTPKRLSLLLASQHSWPDISSLLIEGGRGNDRVDILVDLGDKGRSRKTVPACFSFSDEVIAKLQQRPDILELRE